MKALLVVVIALLLLVGAIAAVLKFAGGGGDEKKTPAALLGDPVAGRQVTLRPEVNCVFCHSDDGSIKQAPSFKGLYGSVVKYDDGTTTLIDGAAVRFALKHPIDKIVEGFEPRMPVLDDKMNENDKVNLIAYLASIGKGK